MIRVLVGLSGLGPGLRVMFRLVIEYRISKAATSAAVFYESPNLTVEF